MLEADYFVERLADIVVDSFDVGQFVNMVVVDSFGDSNHCHAGVAVEPPTEDQLAEPAGCIGVEDVVVVAEDELDAAGVATGESHNK